MSEYEYKGNLWDCIPKTAKEAMGIMDAQAEPWLNMNDELGKEELRKGLQEREEIASFQSRLFQLVGRTWADYKEHFGRNIGHQKPSCQKDKEVSKRRKKNKNKKTHRKR